MSAAYLEALVPVIHELAAVLRAHRAEALEATPHVIDAIVKEVLRDVGRGAAEVLFAEAARRAVATAKMKAEVEGRALHVERSPTITFTSIFGPITVASPYLRPAGPTAVEERQDEPFLVDLPPRGERPVNEALRVRGGGLTLQLQRVLADFGLDGSFEHASAKVKEHYGLDLHRTTVRRTVLKHGEAADREASVKAMEAQFSAPPHSMPGPPLLIEMDGSCVRTGTLKPSGSADRTPKRQLPVRRRTTEWRDLRLGFVRPLDKDEAAFVGGILPMDDVANRLRSEAIELGWTPETTAVRVTDGGSGVREALDRAFPTGVHILDKPHLLHHLYEAAEAMGLDNEGAARAVEGWATRISGGDVDCVIQEFALREGPGKERSVQLANYLGRFRDAVHYDEFVRRGYPIGSGEIESAHKGQVQTRMKLPGTWWTEANANRLLALRLVRANRRWERHWASAA